MIVVDAKGEPCPIPVVMAKEAINKLKGNGEIKVLVDNEIAVQNLEKMARQRGYKSRATKTAPKDYAVIMEIGEVQKEATEPFNCSDSIIKGMLVVIGADTMGNGDEVLGRMLLKGFIFALTKGDILPETIIFYNRGAFMTTEGAVSVDDLRTLEAQGTEILTCGTCLEHYQLKEKLAVGGITNMYTIAEKMLQAKKIVRP